MAIDTAIGAVVGAIGKQGASYGSAKSAVSMGNQLIRRVTKTGEFRKALAYYDKSMRNGVKVCGHHFVCQAFGRTSQQA